MLYDPAVGVKSKKPPTEDGGIGMANIALALRSQGRPADWNLVDESPALRAELCLPPSVRVLASIRIG